jgi:hypothetical protein
MSTSANGLLSLFQNWGNLGGKKKGALSNKEYKSFMDTDSGTEHHVAKLPRNTGAVSDTEMNYFGEQAQAMNIKELQEKFARILGTLQPQEQGQVIKAWSMSDDDGKTNLMNMIVSNPQFATSYGVQDEQPIKNLGIGY